MHTSHSKISQPWRVKSLGFVCSPSFFSLPAACHLFSRGVIFTPACISLALLSLRKNGGLLIVYMYRVYCLLGHPKGERVVQWWEHLPPTNVARVRILLSTPYVGWVCFWFSPLLREVFLCILRKPIWPPVTKSTWSRPSYRKIGDCEQSNIRVKQGTLVKLTVQGAKRMLHLACFPPPAQAFPFAHI